MAVDTPRIARGSGVISVLSVESLKAGKNAPVTIFSPLSYRGQTGEDAVGCVDTSSE